MARGPSFNKNVQIQSLNNVDIYHIACRILELEPNPYATAGSLDNLTSLFRTIEIESTTSAFGSSNSTTSAFGSSTSTTERPVTPMNNGWCLYSTSALGVLFMFFLLSFNF